MKITIVTSLFAEWDMDVNAAHFFSGQWSVVSGQWSV